MKAIIISFAATLIIGGIGIFLIVGPGFSPEHLPNSENVTPSAGETIPPPTPPWSSSTSASEAIVTTPSTSLATPTTLAPKAVSTPTHIPPPATTGKYTIEPVLGDEYAQFERVMKGCLITSDLKDRGKCMDEYTKLLLASFGTKDVLRLLQSGMDSDSTMLIQCHDMAHSIGRQTLVGAGKVDTAFDSCDQTCHSGCYHGVMERVFIPEGASADHISEADLRAKVPTICEGYDGRPIRYKFQCLHGIGHAIDFILENNLAKTLAVCDLLPSQYDISSCWGGALMENITSFDKATRWINRADPHYPCNALDDRYRNDCYVMQTSIMFELGLNPDRIVEECRNAGVARLTCMQSLGRDISSTTRTNMYYGFSICSALPQDEKDSCTRGLIFALMDLTWNGQYAFQFCDQFTIDADKRSCYQSAVNYLQSGLGEAKSEIRGYCDTQSQNREICLQYIPPGE